MIYDKKNFRRFGVKGKSLALDELAKGIIYGVTIIDCSSPEFSGAAWLAFLCNANEVPKEAYSYGKEASFWKGHDDLKLPIGKGKTPDEALEDLKVKAKKYYESW